MTSQTSFTNLFREKAVEHQKTFEAAMRDVKLLETCDVAVKLMVEAVHSRNTIFFCGNGGSAADAQHAAAELVGRYLTERRAISAESLCVDPSILSAIGNDYGFEAIFSRQVEAKGREGDVFFGISTSGKSKNIIAALEAAKKLKLKRILLTSSLVPDSVRSLCDVVVAVPSDVTPRIQETHIFILHLLCEWVEINVT